MIPSESRLPLEPLGNLLICRDLHTVADLQGRAIKLRRREFQLLNFFFNNLNAVIHRCVLLELIWGFVDFSESNTLEVHLSTLRKKLKALGDQVIIQTIRGVGYRLITRPDPAILAA